MGKVEEQQLHLRQQQVEGTRSRRFIASTILCQRCSVGLSTIGQEFNLKCVFVLIFSLSVFLPVIFWLLPLHSSLSGFDAKYAIKHSATVHAYFRLHLRSYENVYVQVTNTIGSTRDPPVTVQAAIISELGSLLPQRLKQLAQTITGSPPAQNLGLNNSVFGKVKEISLSCYLNHTIDATPPTPSPAPARAQNDYAPAPAQNDYAEPPIAPSPDFSPSYFPAPEPDFHHHSPPCFNCDASSPSDDNYPYPPSPEDGRRHSLPPISNSPAPSMVGTRPSRRSPHCGSKIPPSPSPTSDSDTTAPSAFSPYAPRSYPPSVGPTPQLSPDLSPLPVVSYGSSPRQENGNAKGPVSPPFASPSISPSPSSFAIRPYTESWLFSFCGLLTFHLLCWSK
ncbi:hypothetical protein CsSME_00048310 [Camellia sinensis var. sinensis]